MSRQLSPEQIDAILPQTQCGLCGYGGCMPYANALVNENAAINLCPPGGVTGLKIIADLVQEDPAPFVAEMEEKQKPRMIAVIREEECIGCAKCITVCPVDAILGSGKQMHTVITDQCTGCELCIAPCPVDCIDLISLPEISETEKNQKAQQYRARFNSREKRLMGCKSLENKSIESQKNPSAHPISTMEDKKTFIQQALLRAKQKR